MTRKALGRGLNALLREPEPPQASGGVGQIEISLIDPNPFQPRETFSEGKLKELADSIRASGVVQPILVRPVGERYQIVAGERRWRAALLAELSTIPAVVRELDDAQALEMALTENLLREDLHPLEVAKGYEQLQKRFGLTHEEIAQRLGVTRSTITNALRLLTLDPEVQRLLAEDKLSAGHARALAALPSHETQRKLAKLALEREYSVRQVESLVVSPGRIRPRARVSAGEKPPDPNVRSAVMEMERVLGTRVKIVGDDKRGKLEISYYSAEDLSRIFDIIVGRS